MMEYYTMRRKGQFRPAETTNNQCKVRGAGLYYYDITLLFGGNQKLDSNGFIIDHTKIDETVQEAYLYGSCEEMQNKLHKALLQRLSGILAIKSLILPEKTTAKSQAYITKVWVKDSLYVNLIN